MRTKDRSIRGRTRSHQRQREPFSVSRYGWMGKRYPGCEGAGKGRRWCPARPIGVVRSADRNRFLSFDRPAVRLPPSAPPWGAWSGGCSAGGERGERGSDGAARCGLMGRPVTLVVESTHCARGGASFLLLQWLARSGGSVRAVVLLCVLTRLRSVCRLLHGALSPRATGWASAQPRHAAHRPLSGRYSTGHA
jgi:hypothetical protein